jgi:ribonucleoside-diphosphate reductase alpha chain
VWFNIGVKNTPQQASACFILAVEDQMKSILNWYVEEGTIFKGGSGSGINLSRIRSSYEPLEGGGTASGPVSFMRGADASAGTIKSGGKTRRAAKMVILNADHPDIEDFIWCKALEERKARALREAGFDMDLDGRDSHSIQYQNANNSVRVSDEFMQAVLDDDDWDLNAVTSDEVIKTVKARDLFRQIAQATWECADPGMQFDTTINRWHTAASTGRINGSNPCSEYMHLDNSACNLASLNLLTYLRDDDTFDIDGFIAAVQVVFTAQEILVGNADYPTEKIGETSRRFRQLGLGYANLGALLMALGLPYDSDEGRAWAGAITALMTGEAYATSGRTAGRMGPFAGYTDNAEHMNRVLRMHRDEVAKIDEELVPPDLLSAAQQAWDEAVANGEKHGVRNSQATVLAPTGCLVGGTLVPTERGLVRLRSLGDVEGAQWQDLGIEVNTDEGSRTATKFYVNGLEPVVTVDTERGYRIQGTPQHRIKVVDSATGEWSWRRFGDLTPGELVPLALDQLIGEPQRVPLPPAPEAYWTSEHNLSVPREVTSELAELVGYFMGDGSLHSKGLRFCVTDGDFDVVERLEWLAKRALGLPVHIEQAEGNVIVRLDSVRLTLWWEACGFAKRVPATGHVGKGYSPHIPDAILHTNDWSVYAAFLRGLYEADGTVTSGCPSWSTTCMDFSRDVQTLLLAMGFPTTRKIDTKRTGWGTQPIAALRLLNLSLGQRFQETIGFMGARKALAVHEADSAQAARKDHIPVPRALVDQLAPVGHSLRAALLLELRRHGGVSRRIAQRLLDETGDCDLAHLLSFFYDRVATAELRDDEFTYDISVPDNVTYLANGFVSHNTIGLLMDCDTTGVEPDLGLVKMKKLVGGGTMSIVNQTVPRALTRLGYSEEQIADIVAHIDEQKSIIGAPHLAADHLPVFACSMGENEIHYMGHVKMMGAVQPWISGAISKTVNMPETVTVEEVEQLHIEAWKLGVKAIAIYRDNCKVAQPLAMAKKDDDKPAVIEGADTDLARKVAELEQALEIQTVVVKQPVRERLPKRRKSATTKFRVADCEGYVTVGEYDDGRPGEVFMKVSKQGSTLSGIMDAFSISVSLGLQHGVPLRTFVEKYTNMRFEPAGMTDDAELRIASSVLDYIFRRLAVDYLPLDERQELGILTTDERMQPTLPGVEEDVTESVGVVIPERPAATHPKPAAPESDAPFCMQCGVQMQRAGSCHACPSCGTTSGCS